MVDHAPDSPTATPSTGPAFTLRGFATRWRTRIPPFPDLGRAGALIAVALIVAATVCFILIDKYTLHRPLGDTDDAMRLVIVRDLLAGQGWYDQVVRRIVGDGPAYLHWSRLLDGGLAGVMSLLRPWVGAAEAERLSRDFWPLAWVFPAVVAALAIARGLGGRLAVLLTVPLLLIDLQLFRQFIPGRIDHHNLQITMTVIALACALTQANRTRWAVVGGLAAAFGLAIGLEALAFQALVGAAYALELARSRKAGGPAAAYGLSLAIGAIVFAAAQTPPWRWSLSFCDALSLNLVVALAAAGFGLALTAKVSAKVSDRTRLVLLAATGGAAAAAYLGLAPQCLHGPFAAMDPRVRPFWFDHIQEVQTLPTMVRLARLSAIVAIVMTAMGLLAGGVLMAREARPPRTGAVLIFASLIVAAITAYLTWRMQDYMFWIGIPALGAALAEYTQRWLRGLAILGLAAAIVASPDLIGRGIASWTAAAAPARPPPASPGVRCFDARAFATLAKLPPGVILASPDMGPYILALTRHRVVAAPYHRLWQGILASHQAFNARPAAAETRVRALGANYVVDCPPYPMFLDAGSFGDRLRKAPPPPWLKVLSAPKAALVIYQVKKAGAVSGR